MRKSLFESGKAYERGERIKELRANEQRGLSDNADPATWMPQRQYRLLLAYEGKQEADFMRDSRDLMESPCMWDVVPASQRTQRLQTRATLMLSRGAALANKRRDENTNYPNKLIALVSDPTSNGDRKRLEMQAAAGCWLPRFS